MKPVVVFGLGSPSDLAVHYFRTDSDREIVALSVDEPFRNIDSKWGLPVVPYDVLLRDYPPRDCDIFFALGYAKRNRLRKSKFNDAEANGYEFATYVSSRATVLTEEIGRNCFILEDNTLQPFTSVGDNTTLWSGNHVGHHSSIGNHVFVSSHVVISGHCRVEDSCFLGVNATLRDGIAIGENSVIGAGSIVMQNVAREAVLVPQHTTAVM